MALPALLSLLLQAAPVQVVLLSGSAAEAAAKRIPLPENGKRVDGGDVDLALHRDRSVQPFGVNLHELYAQQPDEAWPAELKEDWTAAMAVCRKEVGGKLTPTAIDLAKRCTPELERYLWSRWLTHVGATEVWEVSVRIDGKKQTATADVVRYGPSDDIEERSSLTGPVGKATALAEDAIARVLEGGAQTAKHALANPAFTAPKAAARAVDDPFLGQPPVTIAAFDRASCTGLSTPISIASETVLARSLTASWNAKAKPTEKTTACTLDERVVEESSALMGRVRLVRVALICGSVEARAERAFMPSPQVVLKSVTETVLTRLCTAQKP